MEAAYWAATPYGHPARVKNLHGRHEALGHVVTAGIWWTVFFRFSLIARLFGFPAG
jgi:hypothetical protein